MPASLAESVNLSLFPDAEDMARKRGQHLKVYRQKRLEPDGSWSLDPTWRVRWWKDERDADGQLKRARRSEVFAVARGRGAISKREAQRLADKLYAGKVDEAATHPQSMLTLGEFVAKRFRPDIVARKRSPHYNTILEGHILPAFRNVLLREMDDPDLVQRFIDHKAQSYSWQSLKHMKATLTAILKHARRFRAYQGDMPTQYVILPDKMVTKRGAIEAVQVWAIANELVAPYRQIVLLLACTGLRIGEALGLRWMRLNLGSTARLALGELVPPYCLLVREAWVRGKWSPLKNESSEGMIPIAGPLQRELSEWRLATPFAGPDDAVFTVHAGGKPLQPGQVARKYLKPALEKLGLPVSISWHHFRHTLDSLGDQHGMTPGELQHVMRHSDPTMTEHYRHANIERVRVGLERVAGSIFPAPKKGPGRELGLGDWQGRKAN